MHYNPLVHVAGGKYLNYFNYDGYEFVSRKKEPYIAGNTKPDAVTIIAIHLEKKAMVFVNEFRQPVGDKVLGFPAGLIDEGETPAEAAKRELQEETGLTVLSVSDGGLSGFSSPGMTDEQNHIVTALVTGEIKDNEGLGAHLIPMNKLVNLLYSKQPMSVKVICFLRGMVSASLFQGNI